jgi:hypothetical protein
MSQKRQVGAALSADRTRPAGVRAESTTVEESRASSSPGRAVSQVSGLAYEMAISFCSLHRPALHRAAPRPYSDESVLGDIQSRQTSGRTWLA